MTTSQFPRITDAFQPHRLPRNRRRERHDDRQFTLNFPETE